MNIRNVTGHAASGVNVSKRRIFPARYNHRQIFVRRRHHPTVGRIDLVKLFQPAFAQDLEKKLVRKLSLLVFRGHDPFIDHDPLDAANRFLFRNARVGDAVKMSLQQRLFLFCTELAIFWEPLVMSARYEIE